ncbi:MAG: response regulator [Bacteroidales bacterium]|nr:response regulator [Bacteroidales bacterium]
MAVILLAEDDKELKEMLKIALGRNDFTVIEAEDGKEAITHFRPGIVDLVITDLIMPDEDGLKVILRLRQIKPSLKIIAISGGGKAGPGNYLKMASTLGADAVFSKPFSIADLLKKTQELLGYEH